MKKMRWIRMTAALTALVMALTLLPVLYEQTDAQAAGNYGRTTDGGERIKKKATTDSDYWFRVDKGWLMEILGTVQNGGVTWYKVKTTNPESTSGNTYICYVHGNYFSPVSGEDAAQGASVSTSASSAITGSTGSITNGGVNFRSLSGGSDIKTHGSMMKLERGTVVELLEIPSVIDENHWFKIRYDGLTGYVQAPFVRVLSGSSTGTSVSTAASVNAKYVKLVLSSANLRVSPAGAVAAQWEKTGEVLAVTGASVQKNGRVWYPVTYNGSNYYVSSECVQVVASADSSTASTSTSSTATAAPTAAPTTAPVNATGYVRTTVKGVNLRKSPAGDSMEQIAKDVVLPVTGAPTVSGRYTWYPVRAASGRSGWVRSDCVTVIASGSSSTGDTSASASTAAQETAAQVTAYGYVKTTVGGVNVRNQPDGNKVGQVASKGTVLTVTGNTVTKGKVVWYPITYRGTNGYIHGSYVTVTDAEGNANSTPIVDSAVKAIRTKLDKVNLRAAASKDSSALYNVAVGTIMTYDTTATSGGSTWYRASYNGRQVWVLGSCVETLSASEYQAYVNSNPTAASTSTSESSAAASSSSYTPSTAGQEASYTTLRKGSSGTAVSNMVQELIRQGYYKGSATSSYTSAVEEAVKAFQKAKALAEDGIAGPRTLHALFGTVPVGTGNVSDLSMAIYPAEKIDWYKGGINELWARGANYKVYDVKTGIVWWAHRWAGGSHVDAEPLTADDTARICRIYGVSSADQIKSKNMWERRPCLVTIGTRTFACSLYGIPHNYPDGDTISTNNFKGQVCIHFTNSKTHTSNKVDSYHREAIEYAYLNAPNGHK